jgi:hypothetical protein
VVEAVSLEGEWAVEIEQVLEGTQDGPVAPMAGLWVAVEDGEALSERR